MTSPPPEASDLYAILGVDHHATPAEIEGAFKRRVLETCPEPRLGGGDGADEFRDLRQAYEVLSDPTQRKHYDALQAEIAEPEVESATDGLIIRSGSPRSNLSVGCAAELLQTGLVLLLLAGLILLFPDFSRYADWLLYLGPGVVLGVVWLFRIWYQRQRDRPLAGEVCLTMDAEGLHDRRTQLRIAWDEARGFLINWPEDWVELEVSPEAARRLQAAGQRTQERNGRSYHRLSLRRTDGELTEVERHLRRVLRNTPFKGVGAVSGCGAFT